MNSNTKKDNSLLFKLITLLTFGFTLFLIIFLKRDEGKKVEQPQKEKNSEKSRVQITPQDISNEKESQKIEKQHKDLNQRQIKILKHMREKGRMEPSEIYKLVPDVSTRTVRRDMDALVEAGLVSQRGTTKSTQYIFKG
jgi:predicted HTH transcriptional regulator